MFLIIGILCFLASCIGTISGFGVSTLMTPLLLFFLSYKQTLFLAGIIHWLNSIWKIVLFRHAISWRLFFLFGMSAVLTSIGGALVVSSTSSILLPILGAFLIAYSLFLFFKPTFYVPATNSSLVFGGSIAGFSAGVFGMRGAIRSMFLTAFNLPKEVYLGTTGAISSIVDTARLSIYWWHGATLALTHWVLVVLIILSFIGAYVGRMIVHHIPQSLFRLVVALFLLLMGVRLVLVALF